MKSSTSLFRPREDVFRRIARTTPKERMLLLESATALLWARARLVFVPFRRIRRSMRDGSDTPPECGGRDDEEIAGISWAIGSVARRLPWATCLTRALASRTLFRRRGLPLVIHIGTRNGPDGKFMAHAWAECRGRIVSGNLPELSIFVEVTRLS